MPKVLVFLGNERQELQNSRHNAGFIAAEELRKFHDFPPFQRKWPESHLQNFEWSQGEINGEKVYLVKPIAMDPKKLTADGEENLGYGYGDINHSGFGLKDFLDLVDEKVAMSDVVVFVDALSKEKFPKVRYVTMAACEDETHNGVKSIGNEVCGGFALVEIPIGKLASGQNIRDYVSSNFGDERNPERLGEMDCKRLHARIMADNITKLLQGNFADFVEATVATAKAIEDFFPTKINKIKSQINKEEENVGSSAAEKEARLAEYKAALQQEKSNLLSDVDHYKAFRSAACKGKQVKKSKNSEEALRGTLDKINKSYDADGNDAVRSQSLVSELIKTFSSASAENQTAFSLTRMVLDEIDKQQLREQIIEVQLHNIDPRSAILHDAVEKDICPEQLELLLDRGFGKLVDHQIDGVTPLEKVLEKENVKKSLPIFWQLFPQSSNVENLSDCRIYAEENKEKFTLSKKDQWSDLEIGRLLPHVLLQYHADGLDQKRPLIFTPYYDYTWGRAPKQVLQDVGCTLVAPKYNVANDELFQSRESLEELRAEISQYVRAANGLVVLGNNGNIDPKYFSGAPEKVDLSEFYQRRTLVETMAFEEAIRHSVPVWTICGGTQMALTALGGRISKLEHPQDLRGNYSDYMQVKKYSVLDVGDDLPAKTFSAHYQGVDVKKPTGSTFIARTEKFSVHEIADEFSFDNLPHGVSVIAVSEDHPEIPKAYILQVEGRDIALMMQSHAEADPSINQSAFKAIKEGFVDRCFENLQMDTTRPSNSVARKADAIHRKLDERVVQLESGR